ncbi:MAG: hypothetical protein ACI9C9_002858 [Marivirga sp.]
MATADAVMCNQGNTGDPTNKVLGSAAVKINETLDKSNEN